MKARARLRWSPAGMTQIDGDPEAIHLTDSLAPERSEASGIGHHDAGGKRRGTVVGQLHDAHPEVAKYLERAELTAEHLGTFKRNDDPELAFALCARHVRGNAHLSEVVGVHLDQLLYLGDRGDGVREVVLDSPERQLDDIDTAATHETEVGLRERQPLAQRRRRVAVENQRSGV